MALHDKLLRSLLMIVAVVALCWLPVTSLMIPLLVRSRGWSAVTAGQMLGAEAFAAGVVVVIVPLRGTSRRPGAAMSAGVAVAGVSTIGLAVAGSPVLACAAFALGGVGLGLFRTYVAPLALAATPEPYLSRIQAILILCQTLPFVIGLNLDGVLVSHTGVRGTLLKQLSP